MRHRRHRGAGVEQVHVLRRGREAVVGHEQAVGAAAELAVLGRIDDPKQTALRDLGRILKVFEARLALLDPKVTLDLKDQLELME